MLPYLKEEYGNPSSIYDLGVDSFHALERSRRQIADVLSCNPSSIYFTSGGTESDNWAIIGAAELKKGQGNHIITSKLEHHAILHTCEYLEKKGYEVTYLDVDELGIIKIEQLIKALRPDTILVSVMSANNEIGTIEPIQQIGKILRGNGAFFHTDAVQAFGQIPLRPKELGIDLLSASSHKFHGPKGCGFLYMREQLLLPSFLHGGKQERGRRAGTENVASIVGMGKAAEIAGRDMEKNGKHKKALRDYMIRRIESEIPYTHLNGSRYHRLPGNVNISFLNLDGETLVLLLDVEGISCSSGSACTSGQTEPSHVLQSIGLDADIAKGALRFTLGETTTKDEIDYTVDKLKAIVSNLRKMQTKKSYEIPDGVFEK
jgi:cysteine desulfurase